MDVSASDTSVSITQGNPPLVFAPIIAPRARSCSKVKHDHYLLIITVLAIGAMVGTFINAEKGLQLGLLGLGLSLPILGVSAIYRNKTNDDQAELKNLLQVIFTIGLVWGGICGVSFSEDKSFYAASAFSSTAGMLQEKVVNKVITACRNGCELRVSTPITVASITDE